MRTDVKQRESWEWRDHTPPDALSRKEYGNSAGSYRVNDCIPMGWGGRVSRKEVFLGESMLAERARERKTKTYGSQGVPRVLTVGFRTVAAANPTWVRSPTL